jgi:hypothetical protein
MTVQETIEKTLADAINEKSRTPATIQQLKFIKSEFQRGKTKTVKDDEAIQILLGLKTSAQIILDHTDDISAVRMSESYIELIDEFLPVAPSRQEIERWATENIDFSVLKNKMQAIGIIKKHFGVSVDGNLIKEIINKM